METFASYLAVLVSGVMATVSYITGLLAHYGALSTITALVLIYILIKRLIGVHISDSGSSDTVKRSKK